MSRLLVLFSWCSFAWEAAGEATCDPAEVTQLKKEIEELKAKLGEKCDSDFSVVGAARKAWGLGGALVNHALDQTTVDEQVAGHISTAYSQASAAKDHVASVDYNGYVEQVKTQVAPHLDMLTTAAKPYVEQYVNPALDTASKHVNTALESTTVDEQVIENYNHGTKKLYEEVLPAISAGYSQAYEVLPKHADHAYQMLGSLMSPIFGFMEKIAPGHSKALPKEPLDQLLFLVFLLFVSRFLFSVAIFVARFALKLLGIKVKVGKFLFIKVPMKTVGFSFSWAFWWVTLFYCCGLCRSKKPKATNGTNGDAADSKSKKDAAKKDGGKKKEVPATEKEVTDVLNGYKKDAKKLEAVAKKLVTLAKKGSAVDGDADLKALSGKKMEKAVVEKAVKKFKELDIAKLSK